MAEGAAETETHMLNNDEPRKGKPVVAHKLKGRAAIARQPSPAGRPAAPAVWPAEFVADVEGTEALRNDPANITYVSPDSARPNGDEIDFRMAKIDEILRHAAMPLLEKCALVAEWLHHAEVKLSILGQPVEKSTGRPEGALTRAARELPVPGSTLKARRKFMERALKIDGIWPEAKSAAHSARLDNIQSALLSIAAERSVEAQLAKVQEIATSKAQPRRKSSARDSGKGTASLSIAPSATSGTHSHVGGGVDLSELVVTAIKSSTPEEELQLAALRDSWNTNNVVTRSDWERASLSTRRRFVARFLLGREELRS